MKDMLRQLLQDFEDGKLRADGFVQATRALLAQPEAAAKRQRCPVCDGTGDVHRYDGEYLGRCDCTKPEAAGALAGEGDASAHVERLRSMRQAAIGGMFFDHPDFAAIDAAIAALSAAPVAAQERCVHGVRHPHPCRECEDAALTPAATPVPVGGEGSDCYYIQDTRQFVGNCPMWWCPDGKGYTAHLSRAGRYPKDEAMRIAASRGTDRAWPCSVIDAIASPMVDMQQMPAHSPQDGRKGETA